MKETSGWLPSLSGPGNRGCDQAERIKRAVTGLSDTGLCGLQGQGRGGGGVAVGGTESLSVEEACGLKAKR